MALCGFHLERGAIADRSGRGRGKIRREGPEGSSMNRDIEDIKRDLYAAQETLATGESGFHISERLLSEIIKAAMHAQVEPAYTRDSLRRFAETGNISDLLPNFREWRNFADTLEEGAT
jgi:hypothetical protein